MTARSAAVSKNLDHAVLMEALESLSDSVVIYGRDHRPLFINEVHRRRFPKYCAQLDGGATVAEAMASAARRHMPDASEETLRKVAANLFDSYLKCKSINSRAEDGTIVRTTYREMSDGMRAGISVDISELVRREKELEHRGNELQAANLALTSAQNATRNLLDNADQGFLTIGSDLRVGDQSSAACDRILGQSPAGECIVRLLRPEGGEAADALESTLRSVFRDTPQEIRALKLELLPQGYARCGRNLRASYKYLSESGRLMLILTDVTETIRLEEEIQRERLRLEMTVFALTEGEMMGSLVDEYRQFLRDELRDLLAGPFSPVRRAELYRRLHTYKGLLGQFSFYWSPRCLHDAETVIGQLGDRSIDEAGPELSPEYLMEALEQDLADAGTALSKGSDGARKQVEISSDAFAALVRDAKDVLSTEEGQQCASPRIRKLLQDLAESKAEAGEIDILASLVLHARGVPALAARLNKKVAPVTLKGDRVHVSQEQFGGFLRSLVHVFRNAVDHGLESCEERIGAGKPETGILACEVRMKGGWVEIDINDDGRGIDRSKLERKLAQAGGDPDHARRLSLTELVFIEGLSSRDEASEVSGRGVGLSAVKYQLDRLGGVASVTSQQGQGTRIRFRIPREVESLEARPSLRAMSA